MPKQVIKLLVKGGEAKPNPTLGTRLGPLGLNMGEVISEINKATQDKKGVKVPVNLIIDVVTKDVDVEVGPISASQLILKELNIEKGSKTKEEKVGNLTLEQVKKIAETKAKDTNAKDINKVIRTVVGTCQSMGITINEKEPKEILKELK